MSPKTIPQLLTAWAKDPKVARKCGNLRSDADGRLYSYAMLIAEPGPLGSPIMRVTSERRSATTSRHTNIAELAARLAGWNVVRGELG